MTTDTQPMALRLADWLQAAVQIFPQRGEDDPGGYASEVDQIMDEAAAELCSLHAELETLRAGYAAARLEIESLKAQLAERAKEHADELTVAYMCGASREKELAAQQPGAAYAVLPEYGINTASHAHFRVLGFTADQMRAFADATCALRASRGQAPAQAAPAYKDSTPELHIGDSAFESWYSTYSPVHKSDKQRARDAYAAGMGDPLVTATPAAVAGPKKWAPEEVEDGERGIRWVTNEGIHGRPTDHDVREYLKRTPTANGCLCYECKVFYAAAPTTQPAPPQEVQEPVKLSDEQIKAHGDKASRMMARDLTRFDAACEVDKYLREQGAPGYYRHRMSIVLFGNDEGTEVARAPDTAPQPSPAAQEGK